MSQAKVDRYKQEKANRKENVMKEKKANALRKGVALVVAVALIYISPNIYIASLMPVVSNAIIVGAEIWWAFDMPFAISALEVAAGEFVCVSILGVVLFKVLEKNSRFMRMIKE